MTLAWAALAVAVLLSGTRVTAPGRLVALGTAQRVGPRKPAAGPIRRLSVDASVSLRTSGAWRRTGGWLLAGCTAGAAWWTSGAAIAMASAALALTGWRLLLDVADRRAAAAGSAGLLSAVRVLVGEVAAGSRPGAALGAAATAAGPHSAVFAAAAADADAGADAAAVLARVPQTAAVATAWALGQDTGAPLAAVLERVAADLAARAEQRRSVAVALSGPRASAVVLAGLPAVGLALGVAMGAHPGDFLLSTPTGRLVCCVGVLLDVAGVWWVRHIVRGAERSP